MEIFSNMDFYHISTQTVVLKLFAVFLHNQDTFPETIHPSIALKCKHKTKFSNCIYITSDSSRKTKLLPQNSSNGAQNQTVLSDQSPSQSAWKTPLNSHYTQHRTKENTAGRS
ncbi:hypothetical protein ATANTOWER_023157 [Ataeniobius toweri]|uniref:Uncharacterized protein n=1 Tax=Ataeniobius toweri TaxID=208326 RepID=A0ABU7ASY9_9TELE|nr:hypothetical protein [Ataeniobius toweri]